MKIVSMYWNNIDPRIIKAQSDIFAHFGYPIKQYERTGMDHGDWMDEIMQGLDDQDEGVLFVDIDCFPTRKEAIFHAIERARSGVVYGVGHVANHKDPDHIYAGPVYLCFLKDTWKKLGCPSLKERPESDAGQHLTRVAEQQGLPVELAMPTACLKPMWNLADVGMYGIGTFYQTGIFHLFQSRKSSNIRWFLKVAGIVLRGERMDLVALYKRYQRGFGVF